MKLLLRILKVLFTGILLGVLIVISGMLLPEKYTNYILWGVVILLVPSYWLASYLSYRLLYRAAKSRLKGEKLSGKDALDAINKL